MGRSRITRTFHNKPISKPKKGSNKPKTKSKGLIPQAHAQEAPKQQASHLEEKRIETIKRSKTGYNVFGHGEFMNMDADDLSTYNGITGRRLTSKIKTKPKSKGLIPQAHAQESDTVTYVKKPTKKVTSRRQVSTSVSQPKSTSTYGWQTTHILPENLQSSSGYVSQEKAEKQIEKEGWNNFKFRTTHRSKPHGRNITFRRTDRVESPSDTNFKPTTIYSKYTDLDTEVYRSGSPNTNPKRTILGSVTGGPGKERTILGKFAQGVSNEAQDIGGIAHGVITGNNYKPKSILSRATEHAFAGDWDSAGKVISDNPYRFAGNIATNVGIGFIPFGAVARGAGIAGKVGNAISKSRQVIGKTKGKGRATKATKVSKNKSDRKKLDKTYVSKANFISNMKSTKPTKNSFWQNQFTKEGDDVSGWVDPDAIYEYTSRYGMNQ